MSIEDECIKLEKSVIECLGVPKELLQENNNSAMATIKKSEYNRFWNYKFEDLKYRTISLMFKKHN